MLKYKLLYENEDMVRYQYCPEEKQEFGIVEFSKKTGEGKVIKRASEKELDWYVVHLFAQLRRFSDEGRFKQSGTISWY